MARGRHCAHLPIHSFASSCSGLCPRGRALAAQSRRSTESRPFHCEAGGPRKLSSRQRRVRGDDRGGRHVSVCGSSRRTSSRCRRGPGPRRQGTEAAVAVSRAARASGGSTRNVARPIGVSGERPAYLRAANVWSVMTAPVIVFVTTDLFLAHRKELRSPVEDQIRRGRMGAAARQLHLCKRRPARTFRPGCSPDARTGQGA